MNRSGHEIEEFKDLIDSRDQSDQDNSTLARARQNRQRNRPVQETRMLKLMQLKYQMEDYISNGSSSRFSEFLKMYIDTIYTNRKDFATDIDITPMELSHVLHGRREPKPSFLHRLMVHSENAFKNVTTFNTEIWARLYFLDKTLSFLTSSKEAIQNQAKHVKSKSLKV